MINLEEKCSENINLQPCKCGTVAKQKTIATKLRGEQTICLCSGLVVMWLFHRHLGCFQINLRWLSGISSKQGWIIKNNITPVNNIPDWTICNTSVNGMCTHINGSQRNRRCDLRPHSLSHLSMVLVIIRRIPVLRVRVTRCIIDNKVLRAI